MTPLKLLFLGTPDYVTPVLNNLIESPHQIQLVITQPDAPAGRGQQLTPSPIKILSRQHGIPVLTPTKIDQDLQSQLQNTLAEPPDVAVLAAYGKIIPPWLLEYPKHGIVNLHPSLLPYHRGAMPTLPPILRDEPLVGMSYMLMDQKLDHGPLIAQQAYQLPPENSALRLTKYLFSQSSPILPHLLNYYVDANHQFPQSTPDNLKLFAPPRTQDHSQATFTSRLNKPDVFLHPQLLKAALHQQPASLDLFPQALADLFADIYQPDHAGQYVHRIISALHDTYTPWTTLNIQNQPTRIKLIQSQYDPDQQKFYLITAQLPGKTPTLWTQIQEAFKVEFDSD